MAAGRKRQDTGSESCVGQLTLADWEHDLAVEARTADETRRAAKATPSRVAGDHEPGERQLLTVAEVARATGLSANAIYRAIWSGELEASKLRGRIRVHAQALGAWVDQARVATTNPPKRFRATYAAPRASRAVAGGGRGLRELLQAAGPPA
jgi:excisionase family DNA binding protein